MTNPATAAAAAPAARITNFSAEPRSIQRGQSATLTWSVANATDITIDNGIGAVAANGTRQVFPTNTTTYTLTASSAGGNDTRSVTVEVTAPPAAAASAAASAQGLRHRHVQPRIAAAGDALFDYDKSDIRDDARAGVDA